MENHHFHGKNHYKWPFSIAMLVTLPEGNPYQPLLESQTAWPRGLPNLAEALQWRCQNNALFFWMGLYINKKRLPMEQVTILTIPACSCTCTYSSNIYIYTVNIYTHNIHNIHNIQKIYVNLFAR